MRDSGKEKKKNEDKVLVEDKTPSSTPTIVSESHLNPNSEGVPGQPFTETEGGGLIQPPPG